MVKQFTFQSEFLPLLKSECHAIQAFYNVSYRHTRPHLTRKEITTLQNLEKAIDKLYQQHFTTKTGAFVRLCGRSPKDGEPLHKSKVYSDYQGHLTELLADEAAGQQQQEQVEELQEQEEEQEASLHLKMTAIARTSWLKVGRGLAPPSCIHHAICTP